LRRGTATFSRHTANPVSPESGERNSEVGMEDGDGENDVLDMVEVGI
jgi:hypothetical protein